MFKYMFSALLAVSLVLVLFPQANAQAQESDVDVYTIQLLRVYTSPYGFRTTYQGSDLVRRNIDLPARWFNSREQRMGLIKYTGSASAPYLQAVYRNGEFDHVILVLPESRGDASYGTLQVANTRDLFDAVETFELN